MCSDLVRCQTSAIDDQTLIIQAKECQSKFVSDKSEEKLSNLLAIYEWFKGEEKDMLHHTNCFRQQHINR